MIIVIESSRSVDVDVQDFELHLRIRTPISNSPRYPEHIRCIFGETVNCSLPGPLPQIKKPNIIVSSQK